MRVMAFKIRLGMTTRPGDHLPAFADASGTRWEHRCTWCDETFRTAAELISHVIEERQRNGG